MTTPLRLPPCFVLACCEPLWHRCSNHRYILLHMPSRRHCTSSLVSFVDCNAFKRARFLRPCSARDDQVAVVLLYIVAPIITHPALFHTSIAIKPEAAYMDVPRSACSVSSSAHSVGTARSSDAYHPYLSSSQLSNIETWKKSQHGNAAKSNAAMELPRHDTPDATVRAYLDMKMAMYSKRSKS